jgi:hypothetical protein
MEGSFANLNGDTIINSSDKYRYKKPAADFTMVLRVAWRSAISISVLQAGPALEIMCIIIYKRIWDT